MIKVLQNKAQALGITNAIAIAKIIQSAADVDNRTFDVIVSSMTLHHIPDVAALVKLLSSLLNPGGVIVLYDMEKTAHSHHFHSKHATEHAGVHHHGGFDKHSLTHLLREQGGLRDVVVELAFVGEKPNHEDHEGMMQFNVLCAFGRK
eukprot:TRINITY_DN1955_c0_g1_i2.p1 TRINITY_DN1955_c0_g1~~TRINITY_DN1955_c0_g1_i2.p1  ORF type:complete len:148 (-),score=34.75 TRINITY_DN1955_c0_g1_i2:48-491(-)